MKSTDSPSPSGANSTHHAPSGNKPEDPPQPATRAASCPHPPHPSASAAASKPAGPELALTLAADEASEPLRRIARPASTCTTPETTDPRGSDGGDVGRAAGRIEEVLNLSGIGGQDNVAVLCEERNRSIRDLARP